MGTVCFVMAGHVQESDGEEGSEQSEDSNDSQSQETGDSDADVSELAVDGAEGADAMEHDSAQRPASQAAAVGAKQGADDEQHEQEPTTPTRSRRRSKSDSEEEEEGGSRVGMSPCGLPPGYIASLVQSQYKRGGEGKGQAVQCLPSLTSCTSALWSLEQYFGTLCLG